MMSMKNNERNLFQDLPANRFHSAVFTSFTMDLSHFDNQVLRLLQEKRLCSFNILMDQRQLDQYIDFAIPSVNHVGKEYSVSGIFSRGAFHPKLSLFVGEKDLLLLYGSGNLTVPGLGKNHEVFSGFYANEDEQTQLPLLTEAWTYILNHCKKVDGYVRRRVENEIVENSSLLRQKSKYVPHSFTKIDKSLSAALLYNEKENTIFNQMAELIPFDEVMHITVVSPYYDDDGAALVGLINEAQNAKMDVMLQQDCKLPPGKMKKSKRIQFVDFDLTDRGRDKSYNGFEYTPFLHAKIFHFKTRSGEYCVVGSANATEAALGVREEPKNEEFCVLLHSSSRHFLNELGLTRKESLNLNVAEIERRSGSNTNKLVTNFKIRLDSVDYQDGVIAIYFSNAQTKSTFELSGFDKNGICLFQRQIKLNNDLLKIEIDESSVKYILYFQLFDSNGKAVSNKQIVNDVESLDRTTPSPRNREINRLLSKVERGNYDGLEILEFVGDLFDEAADDDNGMVNRSVGNSDYVRKQNGDRYDKLYVDWNEDDLSLNRKNSYTAITSKLFECIETAIKNKIQSIDEELYGEEDEANPIESASRDNEAQSVPMTKSDSEQLLCEIDRFVLRYLDLISLRDEQAKKVKDEVPCLNQTDVKFFVLAVFSILDLCYFKRQSYDFSQSDDSKADKQNFFFKLATTAKRSLRQVINDFTVFSIKCCGKVIDEGARELLKSCMSCVVLACMKVESECTKDEHYIQQNIHLCLINLVDIYGEPEMEAVQEKLEILSQCFEGVFDLHRTLSYARKMYEVLDEKSYKKYDNFGICSISKQGTKPLEYQYQ